MLQPSALSAPLTAMEVAEPENGASTLILGLATAITDVTRVVMPDAAATSTARVVGHRSGADVCHWLLDMKSRIGCGPQYISVPELLFPVIWTCCAGHWTRHGSMLAGGHSRAWCRWPVTLGALTQVSSMASMAFLDVEICLRRFRPAISPCSAGWSRCSLLVSSMLWYLC